MEDKCPLCGSDLAPIVETKNGRKLQSCSKNLWNKETKKNDGCSYVKWIVEEPKVLDEKCPKCGAPVMMVVTRFGKKMKKCSTNIWNKETKKAEGCDFIEWLGGIKEELDESCPECEKKLILYTTSTGKKMKKCSTSGWDSQKKEATGCTYVEWLRPGDYTPEKDQGTEDLPPDPSI